MPDTSTLTRRAAVKLGLLSALGFEETDARTYPHKRRRECRKSQTHCWGRCYKKKRITCCMLTGNKHPAPIPKSWTCCPATPEDSLQGACPPESPVCCKTLVNGIYIRTCHASGNPCCPITETDPAGGACTADHPVCVPYVLEGTPVRGCEESGRPQCPITSEDPLGGSCPRNLPLCCLYPDDTRMCGPAGHQCCEGGKTCRLDAVCCPPGFPIACARSRSEC